MKGVTVKLLVSAIIGIVIAQVSSPAISFGIAVMVGTGVSAALLLLIIPLLRRAGDKESDGGSELSLPATVQRRRDFLDSYTVIDIETTGLSPLCSEITEMAAIRVRNGSIVDSFQELVAIAGRIPRVVVEKTHITEEMLMDAKPLKEVLEAFFSFVGSDIVIGYNIRKFDVPFISYYADKELGRPLQNKIIDVWDLATRYNPGLPNYRLDSLRSVFNIDSCGAHRALKDCLDTNSVYVKLRRSGKTASARKIKPSIKSIYKMSECDFKARFGERWEIAADIVAAKKEAIANGYEINWDIVRDGWNPAAPATDAQIAMLSGAGIPARNNLSKREASLLIDDAMLELEVARESERRKAKAEKEAAKAARQAEKEKKKSIRESERRNAMAAKKAKDAEEAARKAAKESELEHYDGPRMWVSPRRMAQWRDEFISIWNGILADDVIELGELTMLKNWLNRHKRRRDDFHSMLKLIDDVSADGVVSSDESQLLYGAAMDVLDGLSAEADAPLPDRVDTTTGYKSDTIKRIANEIGAIFHPEYPFLDAIYSPSIRMPVCDLTNYVAEMYSNSDVDSLRELWCYIGGDAERVLLENSFKAIVPDGLHISEAAKAEIWAINALMIRMSSIHGSDHAVSVGAKMLSTTLGCREFSMTDDLLTTLKSDIETELNHANKAGLIVEDNCEIVSQNIKMITRGVAGFEDFASMMKSINPASRLVVVSQCVRTNDTPHPRKLDFALSYGERCYGCSGEINRQMLDALDILAPYDAAKYGFPSSITKSALMSELTHQGMPFKKSSKRDELLKIVQTDPSIVREICVKYVPEMSTIKPELSEAANAWAKRTANLTHLAGALLKQMQVSMGNRRP